MIETPKFPSLYQLNKGKQTGKSNCIHPDCECIDYCEAEDPHSKTPESTKKSIQLPTFSDLAKQELARKSKNSRNITIKIEVLTARMMIEQEK